MTFYYTEPKAGNIWVFALGGGGPARISPGTNLTVLEGSLPRVGEPGHTLGGRVLPGYGHTDFRPALQALDDIGYVYFSGFECAIPPGNDPKVELRKSMDYLNGLR